VTGALATARRLALGAWLARQGLALVPRSELATLRRIAERERQAKPRPWRWRLWRDILRDGWPERFQFAEQDDCCPTCGTPARQRTCAACSLSEWVIPCQHMLPPTIALGLADGSDAGEFYCIACVKETT
jgi:hypothetical protein